MKKQTLHPLTLSHENQKPSRKDACGPGRSQSLRKSGKNKVAPEPSQDLVIRNKVAPSSSMHKPAHGFNSLFRRLTRTSVSRMGASYHTHAHDPSWLRKKGFAIYLKSPHIVAGGKFSGTTVIPIHPAVPLDGLSSLSLTLIGTEVVTDPSRFKPDSHTYEFLNDKLFTKTAKELKSLRTKDKITVPFTAYLGKEYGSSYKDNKAAVLYTLKSTLTYTAVNPTTGVETVQTKIAERTLNVYENLSIHSLSDASMYSPIHEHCQAWRSSCSQTCVNVDFSLSRNIWIAGSPIYVSTKLDNNTNHKISGIKLELIRWQNTFSQTGLIGSFELMPVTSTCEVVAESSLANSEWWNSLDAYSADDALLMIHAPANHVSIRQQKLMDVSYSLRLILCSSSSVDPLAEVPIILVHPISMDPPPNHYLTRRSVNHEHPAGVFLENFERLHQGDHGSLEINASRNSSTTIQISKPKPIRPLAAIRKSLIRWSRRLIQRTASLSSIMSTPSTIASHSTPFQLRIGNSMTPSSLRLSHQQTTTRPLSAVAACTAMPLRHGRIRPPKQFGHEPGALRNAGLDIRTKLDVSTAREAWEGFQAEIHDINGWKAPSEKCEIDYKKLSTASAIPEDGSSLHSAQKGILSPTQAANRHRAKSDIVRV